MTNHIKQCCFFIPLKVGVILLGIFGVLQTLKENLKIIPCLLDNQNNNFDDSKDAEEVGLFFAEDFRKPTLFTMGFLVILSQTSGVASILLIIGTYIENHKLITPYLLIQGLCNFIFGFLGFYDKDLTIIIGFTLNLYWYCCVWSLYLKLKEDKKVAANFALVPEMYFVV